MTVQIEKVILRNLAYNEEFSRKVLPFVKDEYFLEDEERLYFNRLYAHFIDYNKLPTMEAMVVDLKAQKVPAKIFDAAVILAEELNNSKNEPIDNAWLLDQTEEFCQNRAYYLAIIELVKISKGEEKNLSKSAAPEIMTKALAVSFDADVGHDYLRNADNRFEYY